MGDRNLFTGALLASWVFASLVGCGSHDNDSQLNIVNGKAISGDWEPAVVFLYNPTEDQGGGVCTGTFVKPQVLVTAAHCTDYVKNISTDGVSEETEDQTMVIAWDETVDSDGNPDNGISGGFKALAKSSRIFRHRAVNAGNIKSVHTGDLAIVYFEDYESDSFKNIAKFSPRRGATATIVGYGADAIRPSPDDQSVGTKRMGTVRLNSVSEFISFSGPRSTNCSDDCGEGVNAGPGDSGGPMFVDDELVATTSGGSFWLTSYVNLNATSARQFIEGVEDILNLEIND